jgi:parvulin-like peptidyl-prolyl isomerase
MDRRVAAAIVMLACSGCATELASWRPPATQQITRTVHATPSAEDPSVPQPLTVPRVGESAKPLAGQAPKIDPAVSRASVAPEEQARGPSPAPATAPSEIVPAPTSSGDARPGRSVEEAAAASSDEHDRSAKSAGAALIEVPPEEGTAQAPDTSRSNTASTETPIVEVPPPSSEGTATSEATKSPAQSAARAATDASKAGAASSPASLVDAEVQQASTSGTKIMKDFSAGHLAAMTVAEVGDENITWRELKAAYAERIPPEAEPSKADMNHYASELLDLLIDQRLLVQAAKRQINDSKKWDAFTKKVDESWAEQRRGHLLKRYNVTNEYELRNKMEERGISLDDVKRRYRNETIAHEYLRLKIFSKTEPTLHSMQKYYNAHLKEYDRPARVSWREIAVSIDQKTTSAAARRKAEALLARLRAGEDFAKLAKEQSQGATASKGGLWEKMQPGSFAVPPVNEALDRLPLNQVSSIIEGPKSLHIVRVEARFPAGIAPFEAVQDEVRMAVFQEDFNREADALIKKLRSTTLIRSEAFQGTASEPSAARTDASRALPRPNP